MVEGGFEKGFFSDSFHTEVVRALTGQWEPSSICFNLGKVRDIDPLVIDIVAHFPFVFPILRWHKLPSPFPTHHLALIIPIPSPCFNHSHPINLHLPFPSHHFIFTSQSPDSSFQSPVGAFWVSYGQGKTEHFVFFITFSFTQLSPIFTRKRDFFFVWFFFSQVLYKNLEEDAKKQSERK